MIVIVLNGLKIWIEEAVEYDKRDNPEMIIWHIQFVSRKTIELLVRLGVHGTMILSKQVLHIFLGKEYRGKGYALESLKAYIEYFFKQYQINKIIATIRDDNINSWKLLEKTDFYLCEKKMWKDYDDSKECMYRFYEFVKQ